MPAYVFTTADPKLYAHVEDGLDYSDISSTYNGRSDGGGFYFVDHELDDSLLPIFVPNARMPPNIQT